MELAICSRDGPQAERVEQLLRQWLSDIHGQAEIRRFDGPQELESGYLPGRFDFLFLDVQADGLDCARRLRAAGESGPIVFFSDGPEQALACYETHPAGYLLKPVDRERLFALLRWYRALFLPVMERLTVRTARMERQVLAADILYISVQGRTSTLHLGGETVRTNRSLNQLSEELNRASFFRCHREYLVNLAHVLDLRGNYLALDNGQEIPVSENCLRRARRLVEARKITGRS